MKCYGSTSVSKTEGLGSTPRQGAIFEVRGIVGGPVLLAAMGDVTGEPSLRVSGGMRARCSSGLENRATARLMVRFLVPPPSLRGSVD